MSSRATEEVIVDEEGRRWVREGAAPCPSWADDVPVPRDKDGNVVPLATRKLYDEEGREVEVSEIALVDSILYGRLDWRVRTYSGVSLVLDCLHLERPDTWERLEKDIQRAAGGDVCGYYNKAGKPCGNCPAHRTQDSCLLVELRDVMRRTKALVAIGRYCFVDEYGKKCDVEKVF